MGTSRLGFPKGDHTQGEGVPFTVWGPGVLRDRTLSTHHMLCSGSRTKERPQTWIKMCSYSSIANPQNPRPRIQKALHSYQLGLKTRTKVSTGVEKVQLQLRQMISICKAFETQKSCRACRGSPLPRDQDINSCSWE